MATFGGVKPGQTGLIKIMRDAGVPEQYIPYDCPIEDNEGNEKVNINPGNTVRITDHECSPAPIANLQEYDENILQGNSVNITNNDCPTNGSNGGLNGNNSGNIPLAFLNAKSCYCMQILVGMGQTMTEPRYDPECKHDIYQYMAYEDHVSGGDGTNYMWEDDAIIMNMHVHHYTNSKGFQNWYPSGGVWIGVHGVKSKKWYWYDNSDPYLVLRGGPPFYTFIPPESEVVPYPGGYGVYCTDGGSAIKKYRVENFLAHFGLPSNEAVDKVHIHISNNSTLLWYNYVRASLTYFSLCRMNPKSSFTRIFDDMGEDLVRRNEDITEPTNPDNRFPMPQRG